MNKKIWEGRFILSVWMYVRIFECCCHKPTQAIKQQQVLLAGSVIWTPRGVHVNGPTDFRIDYHGGAQDGSDLKRIHIVGLFGVRFIGCIRYLHWFAVMSNPTEYCTAVSEGPPGVPFS